MDDQEARALAEEYRSENSLLHLYEAVILPALALAEQDRHKGALDPEREEFLFLSMREMLAEFSEKAQNSDPEFTGERSESPVQGRILCFPAHDEADEIAAAALAQLLEQAGCATVSFPLGASNESMLAHVEPTASDVFCISAIPPFAFSHSRTINRQLRAKFPKTKIMIGIWGFTGDVERALQRFQPSPPDKFACSLADALEYLGVPTPAAAKVEVPA
jgi:methanogenic corrinoid protein MtbC1